MPRRRALFLAHRAASLTYDVGRATLTAEDLAGTPEQAAAARPDAIVLFNPVYDHGPQGGFGDKQLGARWRDASPAHHLHDDMPPTLVMLGDEDHPVPVATAERFRDRMRELGRRSEVKVYPGEGHGFFNPDRNDGRGFRATLRDTDAFLVSLGYLSAAAEADPAASPQP